MDTDEASSYSATSMPRWISKRAEATLTGLLARHLMLTSEEWAAVYSNERIRRNLLFVIAVACALAAFNSAQQGLPVVNAINALFLIINIASLAMMFIYFRQITYIIIPLLAIFTDILYIVNNVFGAIIDPVTIDEPTLVFCFFHFAINRIIFRRTTALVLNAAVLATVVYIAVNHILHIPGWSFFSGRGAIFTNILLVCVEAALVLHLGMDLLERSIGQLTIARHKVEEMEANRILTEENARFREAIGRINRISVVEAMTTSIAHEMNQPIGSALNYAQAAARWLARPVPVLEEALAAMKGSIEQIHKAGAIIHSIRHMTARSSGEAEAAPVKEVIDSVLSLIRFEVENKGIRLVRGRGLEAPDTDTCLANIRSAEIGQVILNLMSNAADSFFGGQKDRCIQVDLVIRDDTWIEISVTDNGRGIDPVYVDRVFDSFFTSKPGGTGLGLAICREIAEGHGGSISITNANGGGTVATLRIPKLQNP